MRHSVAPNRASQGPVHVNSTAATAKLLEKKKEFDAVSALEKASSLYLKRIESLAEDCDIMADAGQIHGQVLDQWPKMFQILSLFLASREETAKIGDEFSASSSTEGQRLIRIPIEDLQPANTEK
ncbi:hypothetical protein BDQ12DRAFT_673117 [Crucibulum laeve]|uniref:DASH complex subunit DAD2 n=1 Tax=Crucibulum laeve TaxID=68775 RepID=A0A5C3MGI6_9AGAR|nr:hypothetical protein BDQ12DRAFT_673117 [Crucibulum laeve]